MGFFGKKGEDKQPAAQAHDDDYYDSPVEQVSLAKPAAPAVPKPAAPVEEERSSYGIDNAIELMRALPVDQNVELVVQVIKTTLESLKVHVADIIDDASKKQKRLEERVADLKKEIIDFEKEIQTRKEEIARLEADHAETSSVKARLELAEKAQKAAAIAPPKPKVAPVGVKAT
jgi:hypothetical protein